MLTSIIVKSQGFDAWWFDSTEPDVMNALTKESHQYEMKRMKPNHLGSFTRYLNPYVLVMLDYVNNDWRANTPGKRTTILTRSAFAGLQRCGAIPWSGDIGASWEIYRRQISAGLNLCMSGIPFWTFDIGAFLIGSYEGVFTYGFTRGCSNLDVLRRYSAATAATHPAKCGRCRCTPKFLPVSTNSATP